MKHRYRNQWKSDSARFVWANAKGTNAIEESIEAQILDLEREIQVVEAKLKKPLSPDEQAQLNVQLEDLKKEKKLLETDRSTEPIADKYPDLLSGLENRMRNVMDELEKEPDIKKRSKLKQTRAEYLTVLSERKKSINNESEFNDAIETIESDNRLLGAFQDGSFSINHIGPILASGLGKFISEDFQKKLEDEVENLSRVAMSHEDFGSSREKLIFKAEQEWGERLSEIDDEIAHLEQAKSKVARSKKPGDKAMLASIQDRIVLLKKEADDTHTRDEWVKKRAIKLEFEEMPNMLNEMNADTRRQLELFIAEARNMRIEQIRVFIRHQFEAIRTKVAQAKEDGDLDPDQVKQMETILENFDKTFDQENIRTPDKLKNLYKEVKFAAEGLGQSLDGLTQTKNNRESIEAECKILFESIGVGYSGLIEEDADGNSGVLRLENSVRNTQESAQKTLESLRENGQIPEPVYQKLKTYFEQYFTKQIGSLERMRKSSRILGTQLKEIKNIITDIGSVTADELRSIHMDLKKLEVPLAAFTPKKLEQSLSVLQAFDDAKMQELLAKINELQTSDLSPENTERQIFTLLANTFDIGKEEPGAGTEMNGYIGMAIETIKATTSYESAINALKEKLGHDHLELIDARQFSAYQDKDGQTKDLNEYTSGFMVFHQTDETWKIIINSEALEKVPFKEFKSEIVHELRHAQMDLDPELLEHYRQKIIVEKPTEWLELKSDFIAKFGSERPPNYQGKNLKDYAEHWTDDDILHEIIADQDRGTLPASIAAAIMGAQTDDPEITIRGAKYDEAAQAAEMEAAMAGAGEELSPDEEMPDEEASVSYVGNKNDIEGINTQIKDILNLDYIGMIGGATSILNKMKKFNKDTEEINEVFGKNSSKFLGKLVVERVKDIKKDLEGIELKIARIGAEAPNQEMNFVRNYWNNTTFLSIYDVIQLGVNVKEFIERRHKRKKEDHAARLGQALFAGTDLGREMRARELKAEAEEVQEWMSRYENLDAFELQERIDHLANSLMPSPDQLKAILRLLAQKGRIDWRQEGLWKVINKLQSATSFKAGDESLLHNPTLLRQKLHKALGEIWDYDEYLSLERDNEGSWESEKQKYMESNKKIEGQLTQMLEEMLSRHRSGENVDPTEYESVLEYGIVNGKSYPEAVMFYLIVGQAEGLLPPDRGYALDKYLNEWPAIQYIYSQNPPFSKKDYIDICKKHFGTDYKEGKIGDEFRNFFFSVISNDEMVLQRVRKSVSERKWDHDWSRTISMLGDGNTARRFFSGQSGQQMAKDTAVENAYAGTLQWLEENAKNAKNTDFRKNFTRQIAWYAMADGILTNVAYQGASGAPYTRANANMMNSVPREGGVTNHPDFTTKRHREKIGTFIDQVDPFFRMIRGREAEYRVKTDEANYVDEIREYLIKRLPNLQNEWKNLQKMDDIFERIDLITMELTKGLSDAQFMAKMQVLL